MRKPRRGNKTWNANAVWSVITGAESPYGRDRKCAREAGRFPQVLIKAWTSREKKMDRARAKKTAKMLGAQ